MIAIYLEFLCANKFLYIINLSRSSLYFQITNLSVVLCQLFAKSPAKHAQLGYLVKNPTEDE